MVNYYCQKISDRIVINPPTEPVTFCSITKFQKLISLTYFFPVNTLIAQMPSHRGLNNWLLGENNPWQNKDSAN